MIPLPYLALAAALLATTGYALGRFQGAGACEDAHALKEAQVQAEALQRVREQETKFSVEVAKIDAYYRQVLDDANAHSADLARQLDAGTVRLRPTTHCLAGMPANLAPAGGNHVSAPGRESAAVAIVRIGSDADAQLRACQAYARACEALTNGK